VRWWLLAGAVIVTAGCGVDTETSPRRIPADRIPAQLNAPPPSPPTADRPGAVAFTVYLVRGEDLAPVPRALIGTVTVAERLSALAAGPSQEEAASGVRSTLPEGPRLAMTQVAAGVATVDVAANLAAIGGPEQVLAVAQIVFTATEDPAVEAVAFTVDRRPAGTPTGDGSIADRPVRRSDFPGLG
jgi:spore germination protein GerM